MMPGDKIELTSLEAKSVTFKIKFSDPESISLGSYSLNDNLKIGFAKDLVLYNKAGRSVVLDQGDPTLPNLIMVNLPIQP